MRSGPAPVFSLFIMTNVKYLIAARKNYRSAVTRLYGDKNNFSTYDSMKKMNTVSKLKQLKADLTTIDSQINEAEFVEGEENETKLLTNLNACEEYQDKIVEALNIFESLNESPMTTNSFHRGSFDNARSLLKSPTAPLPVFKSTPGENLELFLKNFEETTGKYNYTQYDLFLLLKQQVQGRALFLIESLDADSHTYAQAKESLLKALASRHIQIGNVLRQMVNIKLSLDDEPFEYMSNMKKIRQSFSTLNISINDVMRHFFMIGMNSKGTI